MKMQLLLLCAVTTISSIALACDYGPEDLDLNKFNRVSCSFAWTTEKIEGKLNQGEDEGFCSSKKASFQNVQVGGKLVSADISIYSYWREQFVILTVNGRTYEEGFNNAPVPYVEVKKSNGDIVAACSFLN